MYHRLIADSHFSDIEKVNTRTDYDYEEDRNNNQNSFKNWYTNQVSYSNSINNSNNNSSLTYKKVGKVLHIDGDKLYLKECLLQYQKLGIAAIGFNIEESKQPEAILGLLKLHKPNILIITGHDSVTRGLSSSIDIENYKNSKYYVECVKIAREYNSNYDDLVIFAGGCKSYYEAIMQAGANFASSPNRILIHVTDPVFVAYKVATTSIREILDIDSIVQNTSVGINGIGGIETRGQCREGRPQF